jgi:hypothetical protein
LLELVDNMFSIVSLESNLQEFDFQSSVLEKQKYLGGR